MAIARTMGRTSGRWVMVLALFVAVPGLLQLLTAQSAYADNHADDGGYPWLGASYVDQYYDWGYQSCPKDGPQKDTNCMSLVGYKDEVVNGKKQRVAYGEADPWGYYLKNCTSYVAWKIHQTLGKDINGWGFAAQWSDTSPDPSHSSHPPISSVHPAQGYTPVTGDIAVWGPTKSNAWGHVAYVYAVNNQGVASLDEYNAAGTGLFSNNRTTANTPRNAGTPDNYIHLGTAGGETSPPAASFAGKIVQFDNGPKTQKTAWFVSFDIRRYWIPDTSTYYCLTSRGVAVAGPQTSTVLKQLPDQTGHWARCGSDTLRTNEYLFRGSSLSSSNGRYRLELRKSDGYLVLHDPTGAALWVVSKASDYLVMQPDGNLAAYRYGGGMTWATNTANKGATSLVVRDSGDLALYAPGQALIWSTLFDSQPVAARATSTPVPVPHPTATFTPTVTPAPQPQPHAVNVYANYGTTNWVGHAMCRGNPANSLSMPGGTASQTFTVPSGVASLSSAKVQIDPDATVTAHLSVVVNGTVAATAMAAAAGDTRFTFGPVHVNQGNTVTLKIAFTATSGKIITVYTVGSPGGKFTASNSCPDGAPNVSTTSTGLRAVVSGLSA